MSEPVAIQQWTLAQYLEAELATPLRHEYVAGEIFAMGGGSRAHNLIAGNAHAALRAHLRGRQCYAFIADMKVRIERADAVYYPDVAVTCAPDDRDEYTLRQPCLIIEVLSPTTEAIERREKLLAYRKLDSLIEYLLVAQDRRHVQVYRRADDGSWTEQTYSESDVMSLSSVDLRITLDTLYEDVLPR